MSWERWQFNSILISSSSKIWVNPAFHIPLTLITEFILWFAEHTKKNTNKMFSTNNVLLAAAEQFKASRFLCLTTRLFYFDWIFLICTKKESWVSSGQCNRFSTLAAPAASLPVSEISLPQVNTDEWIGLSGEPASWNQRWQSCGKSLQPGTAFE